mgnify:CR=1 FL=1
MIVKAYLALAEKVVHPVLFYYEYQRIAIFKD